MNTIKGFYFIKNLLLYHFTDGFFHNKGRNEPAIVALIIIQQIQVLRFHQKQSFERIRQLSS